jgi:hypothetical protein
MCDNGSCDAEKAPAAQKVAFHEKFSGAKNDQKKNMGGKTAGGTKLPCQQKGRATIYVSDSRGNALAGISTELSGQKPQETKPPGGAASFTDLDPGPYTAKITLGDLSEKYCVVESENGPKEVPAGGSEEFKFKVGQLATLKVKVVAGKGKKTEKILDGAKVHIERTDGRVSDNKDTMKPDGWATFQKLKPGDYKITVTSLGAYAKDHETPAEKIENVPSGKETEVALGVWQFAQIKFQLIEANSKPEKNIPGLRIAATLPGGKPASEQTRDKVSVVFEQLTQGKVSIEKITSKEDVWEFGSIESQKI